jgi:hypothetical protein
MKTHFLPAFAVLEKSVAQKHLACLETIDNSVIWQRAVAAACHPLTPIHPAGRQPAASHTAATKAKSSLVT